MRTERRAWRALYEHDQAIVELKTAAASPFPDERR